MNLHPEHERLRAAALTIQERRRRNDVGAYPQEFPTEHAKDWHDGHTTAMATVWLELQRALDPEGMAEHDERWQLGGYGTDREWLTKTGCCGRCGNVASDCTCTPDDPCECGPHEIKPWPRPCSWCKGTGRVEPRNAVTCLAEQPRLIATGADAWCLVHGHERVDECEGCKTANRVDELVAEVDRIRTQYEAPRDRYLLALDDIYNGRGDPKDIAAKALAGKDWR